MDTQKIESCTDEAERREYTACMSVLRRPHYGEGTGIVCRLGLVEFRFERPGSAYPETLILLGIPFEYAQKDAVRLAGGIRLSTGKNVWLRCYTGGYEGYLPSGRRLDRDSGYEDMASPYAAESKLILAETVMEMIRSRR